MADVRPLRGIRYNPARVADLAEVTCPPYDVISPTDQRRYYERHARNVIRLEHGLEQGGDSPQDDKYARAASWLQAWLADHTLVAEAAPAFYVYDQEFTSDGRTYRRRALLAAVRLEEWERGVVLPHERTMARPKADRLRLMQATATNLSPLLALYDAADGVAGEVLEEATRRAPAAEFVDEGGEGHRLWVLDQAVPVEALARHLSPAALYMADGHHRYETALHYRDQRRAQQPGYGGDEPFNFVLMALVAMDDPGLLVLPTHRLVAGPPRLEQADLLSRLSVHFDLTRHDLSDSEPAEQVDRVLHNGASPTPAPAFGLYSGQEHALYRLTLRDVAAARAHMPADRSPAWKELEVSVLHSLLIGRVLDGAGEEVGLTFTRDEAQAIHSVRSGENWLALFVRPTRVSQIRDVALARDRMPEKSTYFYPKLITGLVMHHLQ